MTAKKKRSGMEVPVGVWRAALDAEGGAVLLLDRHGAVCYASPSARQILRCDRPEDCSLDDLLAQAGVAASLLPALPVLPSGDACRELLLQDAKGRPCHVRLRRRQLEEKADWSLVTLESEWGSLSQIAREQHALFVNGPMVAFACHAESPSQLAEVSPNVMRLLGHFPEDILLSPDWWREHVHPADRHALDETDWQKAAGGYIYRRYRMLHGAGHWRWVEEYAQRVDAGRIQGYWLDINDQEEGRDRLSKIAASIPGMIFQYRASEAKFGEFSYVSEGARSIFACSPQQLMESSNLVWDRLHPDDRYRVIDEALIAQRYHLPLITEFRIRFDDGHIIWVEGRATPETQPDDSVCWYGIISEVTQRKQIEQALRQSEERLDMAIQAANMGLWDWNVVQGTLEFNKQLLDMTGVDVEQLRAFGQTAWQLLVHPEDVSGIRHCLRQLLGNKAGVYRIEYRLRNASGEWMWVLDKGQVFEKDDNGNVVRVVGTVQDISAHRLAQQLLKNSEAHFRMLFQNHAAVMLLLDPESGLIQDANPSAERFYGYSRDELVGMPMSRINQMTKDKVSGLLNAALSRAHNHFTFTHKVRGGELRTVEVYSSPVESHGKKMLFSIIHDITARRKAEEAFMLQQQQLLAIIENFHGAVVVENQHGDVVLANRQYCRIFMPGVAPEQLKGIRREQLIEQVMQVFADPPAIQSRLQELTFARDPVLGDEVLLADGRVMERDHVPIIVERQLRGFLRVYRDITLRKRQERELRELATTDALTGVANRRSYMEKLQEEFVRFQRFGDPVSVLMMDIDHFKAVNDTWGHAAGDKVLRAFAEVSRSVIRQVDTLGRVGGEEFSVVLPACSLASASKLAERVRKAVAAKRVSNGKDTLRMKVSIGVSCFDAAHQGPDVAMALADQALYEAKLNGRNQVRAFDGGGLPFEVPARPPSSD
ncbi:PAS domain S-box protein [uncultured Aquitalea sp.]|uniref:PAS domain S-box protein n=1 Tax=uncultured Aquitalea sp. TaxID=540272 RepID=UPI0025FFB903|nr:PAS domain S-box protein [uncultured Aquitalea sp.]